MAEEMTTAALSTRHTTSVEGFAEMLAPGKETQEYLLGEADAKV